MMQLSSGTILHKGKYKIERVLGQGGFGISYLASTKIQEQGSLEMIDSEVKVAIKEFFMKDLCNRDATTLRVFVPSIGSRELVERFRKKFVKEANNIADLQHPNVIKVFDVFEENDTAYYAMEYIEGVSLNEKVNKQGALPEAEALQYIRQIASALDYIHQKKINHLDVKPANILLKNNSEAILVDFGLSKQYDKAGEQTSSTPVGVSAGYAPVEQGKPGGVGYFSASTDTYSLGATLYKLVTGKTPPNASDIVSDGIPELPSTISFNTANAIRKAMEPNRHNRPQSVREFLNLLEESADEEETKLIEKLVPSSHENLLKNNKKKIALYVSSFIIIMLFSIFFILFHNSKRNKPEGENIATELEPLFPIQKNSKYGFINKTGKEVISCDYDYAGTFSEGLADIRRNGKTGFIDKAGQEIIPCIYNVAGSFSEGLAFVGKNGKYGFIDKTGKEIIPCIYSVAGSFSEGLVCIKKNGKYGFIDKTGKEVIPCIYDDAWSFSEKLVSIKKNGKYGFIDKTGKEVIPCIYDDAWSFSEGLALIEKNGKRGFIDKIGKMVIPCIYDRADGFFEGLANIYKNGKWGFIDNTGKIVIPCVYDDTGHFSEGLATVAKNHKWGFIDKTGKEVIPCIYDYAEAFSEGLAQVAKNRKWGYIDKTGQEIIPCIYDNTEIEFEDFPGNI